MADNTPSVQDLPKIDTNIKEELTKEPHLKHVEVHEKNVLPSADDVKQEKVHVDLLKGVETFSPEHLKRTKTREPASATEIMQAEIVHTSSLKEVESFKRESLKTVEVHEKNPLPDQEAIKQEEDHLKFKTGIESFDKQSLAKTSTVEKNPLPTQEVIEAEKKGE